MTRITLARLEHRVAQLNKLLGRPATPYTRTADKKIVPNAGHLLVDAYAPDRVTLCALGEMLERGGQSNHTNSRYTCSEFDALLDGIMLGLDFAQRRKGAK